MIGSQSMNSAQEQTITTLDSKTQDMIVKLTPFSEARLLESLVTKQHFVLIAARNVDELSDDDGNLIASQIRSYTPERIAQIFDKIGGVQTPFYTTPLITDVIPVYTFEQILSKAVWSCMFTFDEVEFDGIIQQIGQIAKLINVHSAADAQAFITTMQNAGFKTKCSFALDIGTTYSGKNPESKCFKWRVDILPSGQAVFVVALFDKLENENLYEVQLSVSFVKLINVVLGSR